MESYVIPKQASSYYGVSENTLRKWAEEGKLRFKRTDGGHRRYYIPNENKDGKNIVYARVSSRKQDEDLERQIKYLKERYPNHEVISDIGSGINYKRTGFKTILGLLFQNNIREVVVASPDRFSRFGANELFAWIFTQFGAKLTFVHNEENEYDDGLTSELMEIITVFSARYYGRRKYREQKDKDLPKPAAD